MFYRLHGKIRAKEEVMHQVLDKLVGELEQVASTVTSAIPSTDPFGVAHNNWSFPSVTRFDIANVATEMVELIKNRETDVLDQQEIPFLSDYLRRLAFLRAQTIPNMWSNPSLAVPAYLETLRPLRQALERTLTSTNKADIDATLKRLRSQVRAMESRANDLLPRTQAIEDVVTRIEQAGAAADQLPTDLEELGRARTEIDGFRRSASTSLAAIQQASTDSKELAEQLKQRAKDADDVLEKCQRAYSAAASQGLAAAFAERSKSLTVSMSLWTLGLMAALAIGAFIGSDQLESLGSLIRTAGVQPSLVFINMALAFVSVGAPVWFAWLATKQVSQSFRLSEDYAFKAAVSRAYEGYRREAERIDSETQDSDMKARLLASALTRLDEQPLRVVDPSTPGSPWHDLMSSRAVTEAIKLVPNFVGQVKDLATKVLEKPNRESGFAKFKAPDGE